MKRQRQCRWCWQKMYKASEYPFYEAKRTRRLANREWSGHWLVRSDQFQSCPPPQATWQSRELLPVFQINGGTFYKLSQNFRKQFIHSRVARAAESLPLSRRAAVEPRWAIAPPTTRAHPWSTRATKAILGLEVVETTAAWPRLVRAVIAPSRRGRAFAELSHERHVLQETYVLGEERRGGCVVNILFILKMLNRKQVNF